MLESKMKPKSIFVAAMFLVAATFVQAQETSGKNLTIAITQITSHPSLDLIRSGIIDVVKQKHPKIKVVYKNAQGNITIAAQIAQNFAALNPNIIVPITTPSAQTVVRATQGKNIPVVFSAITDPIGAGILKSLSASQNNLTGVVDQPPVAQTIKLMQKVNSKIKTVGVIYNASETNSIFQIESIKKAAKQADIKITEIPISKSSDIQMAAEKLSQEADAIFLPNDNLVISALATILKVAKDRKVPVYASDPESVKSGVFAALAFDQYQIGVKTGEVVLKVLAAGSVATIPPHLLGNPQLYINNTVANDIGLSDADIKELQSEFGTEEETSDSEST